MTDSTSQFVLMRVSELDNWFFFGDEQNFVTTPLGKPLGTSIRELAGIMFGHIERFGRSPSATVSSISLQCSYLDFGLEVPRTELIANTLQGYTPAEDFALRRPAEPEAMMDMLTAFGPMEPQSAIQAWLSSASLRTLMCAQSVGARFESILTAYRLLHTQVPPATLAAGLERWGPTYEDADTICEILERVLDFSRFPDEQYPSPEAWKAVSKL